MGRRKRTPTTHRFLAAISASGESLILAGSAQFNWELPLPDMRGLWVAEWDTDNAVYAWHRATAFELATAGLIESYTCEELEARLAYLEQRDAAF